MSDKLNENYDALDGWRESTGVGKDKIDGKKNFVQYAGDSEYGDPTTEIIRAFCELPKEEQDRVVEDYMAKQSDGEQTLDR